MNSEIIQTYEPKYTKYIFWALCFYLLSQAYTIPILAVGPSWALWPNISDLTCGLLIFSLIANIKHASPASEANRKIFKTLIFTILACILSYILYLDWIYNVSASFENAKGITFGLFQIYRLIQFIGIFWSTSLIPLTPKRINTLSKIVSFTLIFVCLGVVLTFTSILPLTSVTAHLPNEGAWIFYTAYGASGEGKGLGFVGYNHAYVAAQIMMLVGLRIHLASDNNQILQNTLLICLSLASSFICGSRSGFLGMLFFSIIYIYCSKKPKYEFIIAYATLIPILIAFIIKPAALFNSKYLNSSIVERQKTLLETGNTSNLSGRDIIWLERLEFLNKKPLRWLFGSGFGAATDSGENAHNLYLHIIVETGTVGLILFLYLFSQILYYLYQNEAGMKAIFWMTIAILISSSSQETLYPVVALGHFLGFYFCCLAIALRKSVA
ncbi:O-antigen ligase family protein [Acaryochloris marina NIES-2412]|uniref:O-antigen ligase family protein n=1 Tax=Acaryochloris marina TaxID=155978 RepID=UPI0040580F3A